MPRTPESYPIPMPEGFSPEYYQAAESLRRMFAHYFLDEAKFPRDRRRAPRVVSLGSGAAGVLEAVALKSIWPRLQYKGYDSAPVMIHVSNQFLESFDSAPEGIQFERRDVTRGISEEDGSIDILLLRNPSPSSPLTDVGVMQDMIRKVKVGGIIFATCANDVASPNERRVFFLPSQIESSLIRRAFQGFIDDKALEVVADEVNPSPHHSMYLGYPDEVVEVFRKVQ